MKIAIVGGGFAGLTAAYELTKQGHDVTVFEKESYLGGLAFGFKNSVAQLRQGSAGHSSMATPLRSPAQRDEEWDWSLEYAYHHLFTSDEAILSLAKELGIGDKLITKRPITSSLYDGKMYALDSATSLLKFPGLPLLDRIRTGIFIAALKVNPFWQPLEKITAKNLAQTFGGEAGWKAIWEPLMVGKFSDYSDSIAASWLWARIKKRTPSLVYFEGGFLTFINALESNIKSQGGTILKSTTITAIESAGSLCFIITYGKKSETFDKLLLTTPTPLAAKLLKNLTTDNKQLTTYFEEPMKIPHLHAQVMVLETKDPILNDVYWLNMTDRSYPFLAVVAHTNYMDKSHYGGHHITYVGNYLPSTHPFITMDKEALLKKFMPYLQKLNKQFNNKTIIESYLFTGPFAQPVHQLNYSSRAPKLETPVPNLYIANMDSVYPWDRGTNYAVELGQKAANCLLP